MGLPCRGGSAATALLVAACTQNYQVFEVGSGSGSSGGGGAGGPGTTSVAESTGTATGSGGQAAAGGGGAASSGGASVGPGGNGGAGGTVVPGFCGDGAIDPGEECDAGGASPTCDATCNVICNGLYDVEDDATHHCYYMTLVDGDHSTWQGGRDFCVAWGGDLAVIESSTEHAFITANLPQTYNEDEWIGGTNTGGQLAWVNGAAWSFPPNQAPWFPGEPSGEPCLAIHPDGGLVDKSCTAGGTHHMCERAPAGR